MAYKDNMEFEAEVRRVAEAVWDMNPGECQPMHYKDDPVVREIDGIARLRDLTHLMMVTVSTRLDKVKEDVKKLAAAERIEKNQALAVSKWLITLKQLDAEHVDYARKNNVLALTFEQFRRRFFDSAKYLTARSSGPFGSARDPITDSVTISAGAYVELPITITAETGRPAAKRRSTSLAEISKMISSGNIVVLRAPFGSGKSLTTREIFNSLSKSHRQDENLPVPVALNLREHWGEDHFDEILERHARSIGYTPKSDLVIAWRSSMCCLLLDGFDEVAAQSLVRTDNKNFMRDARRQALTGIRDFTTKLPAGVGLLLCGRDHYFDSDEELISSLGLAGRKVFLADLEEFTEANANEFLRRNGITKNLPDWLPRKPLILSYLLREKLFEDILAIDGSRGFGYAWDAFLNRICTREASLEKSTMDPTTVRAVLERLAYSVRSKSSGTGPIVGNDLAEAYSAETGQPPGEGVITQLQRLPGLTQREAEAGSRSFVDLDMLGALQGTAFCKHVLSSFREATSIPLTGLSDRAIEMASHAMQQGSTSVETLVEICIAQSKLSHHLAQSQNMADCVAVAIQMAVDTGVDLDLKGINIEGASIDRIPLDEVKIRRIKFTDCVIHDLSIGDPGSLEEVVFSGCLINRVIGISNIAGLPKENFQAECEISNYDNISTTSAVLRLDIAPQVKALITILRKLYKQAGAGRKRSAFSRGITRPEVLRYIEPVLEVLQRHEFISVFNSVVHPVRRQRPRVDEILASPALTTDALAAEVRDL